MTLNRSLFPASADASSTHEAQHSIDLGGDKVNLAVQHQYTLLYPHTLSKHFKVTMKLSTALLVVLWTSRASAFSISGRESRPTLLSSTANTRKKKALRMSEPSDTSSDFNQDDMDDEIVEIESESYNPTPEEAVVNSVMDLMPTGGDWTNVSEETRAAINEALVKLEALNPTKEPTISPLLNGVWELRYVGGYSLDGALPSPTRQAALFLYSGGYSPGLFALTLAQKLPTALIECDDLEIAISRQQPRIEASINVKFFGGMQSKISVTARLETLSDVRLRETYEEVTFLDQSIDLPAGPLQYGRDLYVTYVDEDLLVVRDASGIPEVLVRKEKTFRTTPVEEP